MNLQTVLLVLASLVGLPALWAFLIDIGKWAGFVTDDNSAKWSAVFNMLGLVTMAIIVNFYPHLDVVGLDAKLLEMVKFGVLILGYIVQIFGSKLTHKLLLSRVTAFSFTKQAALLKSPVRK